MKFDLKKIYIGEKLYLKWTTNQINVLDALMSAGGKKIYSGKLGDAKYSEHFGLLDFNFKGLEKIILSTKMRLDPSDDEIYMPKNIPDAYDYEYMFHTHPPTPKIGGRAKDGVLYEFPSISDLMHFVEHSNEGETQGSVVITPEGIYIIRKYIDNKKKIKLNYDSFNSKFNDLYHQL